MASTPMIPGSGVAGRDALRADGAAFGAGLVLLRQVPKVKRFLAYLPEGPVVDWTGGDGGDLAGWLTPMTEHLKEAIEGLPERARYVLVRRYGLDDREPATLAELGDELDISRERVRQLQREAERILTGGEYGRVLRDAVA